MDLKLPPEIEAALAREARRAHKPKAALLLRAVEAYLEELADARAVETARSQAGKPIPWTEVKRRQGLRKARPAVPAAYPEVHRNA